MTYQHFYRILFAIQINTVGLAEGLIQEINKREPYYWRLPWKLLSKGPQIHYNKQVPDDLCTCGW